MWPFFFSLLLLYFVLSFLFFARRMLKTFGAFFCSPNTKQARCVPCMALITRENTDSTDNHKQAVLLLPCACTCMYLSGGRKTSPLRYSCSTA